MFSLADNEVKRPPRIRSNGNAGYEVATWRAMLPEERFHDSGSRYADPATIAIVEGGAV